MLKTYQPRNSFFFYYDIENKTVARFPTNSNLKLIGSDNSLFFGMTKDKNVYSLFADFFEVKKIEDLSGAKYTMKCNSEDVDVALNINGEGQIQIKICKDGTIGRLANMYMFDKMEEVDFTKMLIVIDFLNNEIRFKDPNTLKL